MTNPYSANEGKPAEKPQKAPAPEKRGKRGLERKKTASCDTSHRGTNACDARKERGTPASTARSRRLIKKAKPLKDYWKPNQKNTPLVVFFEWDFPIIPSIGGRDLYGGVFKPGIHYFLLKNLTLGLNFTLSPSRNRELEDGEEGVPDGAITFYSMVGVEARYYPFISRHFGLFLLGNIESGTFTISSEKYPVEAYSIGLGTDIMFKYMRIHISVQLKHYDQNALGSDTIPVFSFGLSFSYPLVLLFLSGFISA